MLSSQAWVKRRTFNFVVALFTNGAIISVYKCNYAYLEEACGINKTDIGSETRHYCCLTGRWIKNPYQFYEDDETRIKYFLECTT